MDHITLLDLAIQAAITAGKEILKIYEPDFFVETKSDNTPVTLADKAASNSIVLALTTSNIPIISEEETILDYEIRKNWPKVWLVDPLDGTKEFISRTDEFTINIALVRNGSVDFGLIHAPALDEMYWGDKLFGSYMAIGSTFKKISVSEPTFSEPVKLISSRNHSDQETTHFIDTFSNKISTNIGSSLKFCLIAKGEAHVYPRFGRTCIWDTGAGQAILENAGGYVSLLSGQSLTYNQSTIYNPNFIASAMPFSKIETLHSIN
jgi:3'(2'), 5'-bisphosphate nucleotidase